MARPNYLQKLESLILDSIETAKQNGSDLFELSIYSQDLGLKEYTDIHIDGIQLKFHELNEKYGTQDYNNLFEPELLNDDSYQFFIYLECYLKNINLEKLTNLK